MSWSVQPTVATRVGSFSMVVSPKACLMVTGKASASALVLVVAASSSVEPVLQPVRASAPSVTASARWRSRFMGFLESGGQLVRQA